MVQLEQRPGESDLSYHKRLIYGKIVDKTLSDIDYSELAESVYGRQYSSDVARRMMYGSQRTLQLIEESGREEAAALQSTEDIDARIADLQKERQRYYDQRREYNKVLNAEAREEHLVDRLISAADSMVSTVGCFYNEKIVNVDTLSDEEAVVVFSDWHFGLKTSNAFNEFDTDICRDRIKNVTYNAIKRIERHKCKKLHVIILGDLYHGAIHASARVASEELVSDQLMMATEILAQSIERMNQFVEETYIYMTYGNHARTVQNKKDSIHRDNMERLVPWWLEQRFKDRDDITVIKDNGTEFVLADVCNHQICAVHGDNDTVRSSPKVLSTLFFKKFGRDIEYILIGDKHHRESYDELGVTAMMCGSLCGTDDYANEKRLFSEPSQLMLVVSPKCGVDAEYRLRCDCLC